LSVRLCVFSIFLFSAACVKINPCKRETLLVSYSVAAGGAGATLLVGVTTNGNLLTSSQYVACNSAPTTAKAAVGYDVRVAFDGPSNGTINLSGNAWDHATPTIAGAGNGQDLFADATHAPPTITTDLPTMANVVCDGDRIH
jgi:hypothetical protein